MHNLLNKLLNTRKIIKEQLSSEEKIDFNRWEKILSGGEITVERIKEFCESQLSIIELQWKDMNNTKEKNERLIICHTIYKTIIQAISSPEAERSTLEDYLNQLITKQ